MPIIFRNNPIPTTGALYVTNPGMPRRENGKLYRFIFEELFGRRGSSGKKSADQTLIRNMLFKGTGGTAAQRKKAQKMREDVLSKKGATYKKYLKYRTEATKAYKAVLDKASKGKTTKKKTSRKSTAKKTTAKKGKTGIVKAKNGRKMHYVDGNLVSADNYKKLTGKKSRASTQKKTAAKKTKAKTKKNPRSKPMRKNSALDRWIAYKFFDLRDFPGQLTLDQEIAVKGLSKPRNLGGTGTASERRQVADWKKDWMKDRTEEALEMKALVSGRRRQVAERRAKFARMSPSEKAASRKPSRAKQQKSQRDLFSNLFSGSRASKQKSSTSGIYAGLSGPDKRKVTRIFLDSENKRQFSQQIILQGVDVESTDIITLYNELDNQYKNNPKRRNPMAKAKASKKTGKWKGRMISYKTFTKRLTGCGLSGPMRSKMWARYKATGKLPALAQSKKRASTQKAVVSRATGVTKKVKASNGKMMYFVKGKRTTKEKYMAATKKKSTAKKSTAKKSGSSQKTKVGQQIQKLRREAGMRKIDLRGPKYDTLAKRRAILKELKDQLAGKSPAKKKTAKKSTAKKSTRAKRPSTMTQGEKYKVYMAERRKMSAAKKGEPLRGGKRTGTHSYNTHQKQWKKDQPKIEALCKKTRKSFRTCVREFVRDFYGEYTPARSRLKTIGKSRGGTGAKITGFKRGGKSSSVLTPGFSRSKRSSSRASAQKTDIKGFLPGPVGTKANPFAQGATLSTPFAFAGDLIKNLQDTVASIPVVNMATPYVAPIALGGLVAGVHYLGGRYIGPELQKVEALRGLDKVGYTLVGISTALLIRLGQNYLDLFESVEAERVAQLAVLTGAFVDGLDYFRGQYSATNTPIAGIAMNGGYGGGQYFVAPMSEGTQAPLRRHMRQVAPQASDYQGIVAPLSGAAPGAQGYGALMYTGSGY